MLAVDERGEPVDGDQILAVLALALGVDGVAVTTMTNLGFHRLMEERGIRVVVTDVGDRYVLEALRREGCCSAASSRATSSGSTATSRATASSPGSSSAARSRGRRLSEAVAVMPRFPQVDAEPAARRARPAARERCSRRSSASTRSSTARAASSSGRPAPSRSCACWPRPKREEAAEDLCASVAALVTHELG